MAAPTPELKALILCGGKGTRLHPITNAIPKHLLPVANRPILFYLLDHVARAGIKEVGVVISPGVGEAIPRALGDGSRWGVHFVFVTQTEPRGLAHAVSVARDFLADSPFLLLLGDNLIRQGNVEAAVAQFLRFRPAAVVSLKEVADPRAFGVAQVDATGRVLHLEEKPRNPLSHLVLTGIYVFSPLIHSAIAGLEPSWRGELEITDAIQRLVAGRHPVLSCRLEGWWLDTGRVEDLLRANQVALDEVTEADIEGTMDDSTHITGKIHLGAGAVVTCSHLQGPVSIAPDCSISNAVVGPYVSIGAGAVVTDTSIENAIVLPGCHIHSIALSGGIICGHCHLDATPSPVA